MNNELPELDFYLPTGEDLRVFLNQEMITVALLRQMLRGRGILCPFRDKKDLLPYFLLSYLTPDEFDFLLDALRKKEDTSKVRNHSFSVLFSGNSLGEVLPTDLDFHGISADEFGNYEVVNSPMLEADPEEGKPSFIIRLKTKRTVLSADVTNSCRVFESSIRYTLDAEAKRLIITTNHTSNETQQVNDRIVAAINKHLTQQQLITPESEFRVRFNSFNNEERIRFFMQFTGLNEWNGASFEKLKELSLKLDEKSNPPDREGLTWMMNKVNRVNLKGKALERTFFVDDSTCRPFVIFWRMEMRFKVTTSDYNGYFDAVLEFADYADNEKEQQNAEFQIHVGDPHIKGDSVEKFSRKDFRDKFNRKFLKLKEEAYNKIKSSNDISTSH